MESRIHSVGALSDVELGKQMNLPLRRHDAGCLPRHFLLLTFAS